MSSLSQPSSQQYCTLRYLNVPLHGSSKTLFEAGTEQLVWPSHRAVTMSRDMAWWQFRLSVSLSTSMPALECGHTFEPWWRPYDASKMLMNPLPRQSRIKLCPSHARASALT